MTVYGRIITLWTFLAAHVATTSSMADDYTIRPVSGSTTNSILFGAITNTIDGTIDADMFLALGSQVGGPFTGPYEVRFDLGSTFTLSGMDLWNNAGNLDNDGEGVHLFELHFLDANYQLLGTFTTNAADSLTQQTFTMFASHVRYVDFLIISNHAPNIRGYALFHEISFRGRRETPVFTGIDVESGIVRISISNLTVGTTWVLYRTHDLLVPQWSNITEFVAHGFSTNLVDSFHAPPAFYSVGSK